MKAALLRHAPGAIIIDLLHRASTFDPKAGAYLLAALQSYFPKGAVFLAIVDPGVGGLREAIAIEADDIGTSGRITDCCPLSPHAQDDRVKKVVTEYSVAELDALLEITAYEQMSARERFTPEIAAPERSFESSSHWSPLLWYHSETDV